MAHLPSLPAEAQLPDLVRAHPRTTAPIVAYNELVLRGPSPLSPGERELIAAYVSGLNACGYCHDTHGPIAVAFGVPEGVLAAALADLDSAPVDARLRPLLRYVGILTRTPSQVVAADAEAVFAAGWDEQALHDAIVVCALFNFMNRLVDGHGLAAGPAALAAAAEHLHQHGYSGVGGGGR